MDTTYGALLLLIACVIGGGVAGALLRTWDIHRRTYTLEVLMGEMQGIVQREVKIRAGTARQAAPKIDREVQEMVRAAGNTPATQAVPLQWWGAKG